MTLIAVMAMGASDVFAQNQNASNLTSSPYTRYGFGRMGSVGNASTRAMGEIGIGLRTNSFTNLANPASLTAIDTLTMLFDTAVEAQMYRQSEEGASTSDWDAGLSYMSFHFPLWSRWAGALSFSPYSMVGYQYGFDTEVPISNELITNDTLVYSNNYSGTGGLQKFQASLAWEAVKTKKNRLSIGANIGYICGNVNHAGSMYVSSGQANSTYTVREYTAKGFDATFGMQYTRALSADRKMTIGATFSPRTPINVDSEVLKYTSSDVNDTISSSFNVSAPMKFGVGMTIDLRQNLMVGIEYSFENWEKVAGLNANLEKTDGIYKNMSKFALGLDYVPSLRTNSYFKACHYRAGFNMKKSYIETYGSQNTEYTASCGICAPIIGQRSYLNLSAAYTHVQPAKSGMLKEDYLSITLGITFNEMMFFRRQLR